ncbi:e22bdcbc-903e-4ce4-8f6d-bac6deebe0ff [Sclerotinia trifoliorum]|uniref:E22bdcbc-903e-4ce4-8f6d-bac6deebe0ff n=1 Tax=Sclerotinia trifoliorum TaxID=28548 RepID=A0A8H2VPH1_9HELO|nr:e22bdcbc-903e-4ce4-8f6d-bac6deebe0ff [Sclerotinia trifoliorum]
MSSKHVPNSPQASPLNKSSDIRCVQTTKGWVCALCFPLGHPSRAIERLLDISELKSHAAGSHYASLGEHEWKNYVNHSVYYEAQFRGQSSLGLNDGVMHGPPTIASQKTIANKAGVLKRKYPKKAKPVVETAFDLMETMINFDGKTDAKDRIKGFAPPGGNRDEGSEMSDVESAPTTLQAYIGSLSNLSTAQHQLFRQPMNSAHIAEPLNSLQTGTGPFYNQFVAQNQFSMHSMEVSQVDTTKATPHTGDGSYCDTSTANYGMHQAGVFQVGASPINNPSTTNLHFGTDSMDIPQATSSPSKPSRKKAASSKNPLRQRLSENPSFESAVSVHGLARVQAAGNVGLQRYLDRQARGLPRASNIPLPLASSPPRNSTMGLPLTAANYAAAGMPNIHVEKAVRRTKKVDRRRQVSLSLSNIADVEDNTTPYANPPPTLNEFGVPTAIFGKAPGAVYKSHTYKSIYAESTPPKEHLPSEASFFDFSFSEPSEVPTKNEVVQQDPWCQLGTIGTFDHGPNTDFTDSFVSGLLNETFGAYSGEHQNITKHSDRNTSRTLEPDQLLNDMGLGRISEDFDFNAFIADPKYNFDGVSTVSNTIPQQSTGNFNESFATADIPKQSPVPQHNAAKSEDFFSAAGIPKTHDSELHALFCFSNPSSPTNTNHNFGVFHTTSLEYGAAGLEAVRTAQAAVSAGKSLYPPRWTASSPAIVDSSTSATLASSHLVEASSAHNDAIQVSEDLPLAISTPSSHVAESWSLVEIPQAIESPTAAAAESVAVFESLHAVESAVPIQVPTIPAMSAPETAYMITGQQNVLAAMSKRQVSAIKNLTNQLAQQNAKTAATTTTKEPAVKQTVVVRKPHINTEKLVVPAELPSAYFTNAAVYHSRKAIVATKNVTSATRRARVSRQGAISSEPALTPRKRAASPEEEPSGDRK